MVEGCWKGEYGVNMGKCRLMNLCIRMSNPIEGQGEESTVESA